MDVNNVNGVSANQIEQAKIVKPLIDEKINCVFDADQKKTQAEPEKKSESEIIYLKNSSYKEFTQNTYGEASKLMFLGQAVGAYLIERNKESKDFTKIQNGELLGKTVFLNKKEYKAYIKGHPEEKNNTVLMRSNKGKAFVRDNAQKLGYEVRGEYRTPAEIRQANSEAIADLRQARAEYKQAKAEAKAEYKQKIEDFYNNYH